VAQLVFPWIIGGRTAPNTAEYRRIRASIVEDGVGGIIIGRGQAAEFAPMLNGLQELTKLPLLVISDLETGPGQRMTGGTLVPPAMAIGAAGDRDLAYRAGQLTAVEARAAGIHVTLGPVLDVNSNPLNPIINVRSFGEDPARVAEIAQAWIAGARAGGLLTIPKHFPGHGATETDSHIGLATVTASREVLEKLDLVPFISAARTGVDGFLVGHITVPAVDGPNAPPASLSPAIVTGILRNQIGFDGLVFTDAMNMGAITANWGVQEASILALLAGVDALLQPPGERSVINAVVAAVRSGRIPESRIEEAARRVLTAKAAAGLHKGALVPVPSPRPSAEHAAVAARLAAASLTLVRDRDRLVPLPRGSTRVLHVAYSLDDSFRAPTFSSTLERAGYQVTTETVSPNSTAERFRALTSRAKAADLVVVSANLVPREYRGPLALRDRYSSFVEGLIVDGVPMVAVSFGSPYLLDYFPSISSYLIAWSTGVESQRAAAQALAGQIPITGHLPVSLPPYHTIGEGVTRNVR
jgi:beta-N-acetylhexosaminidase